jgi:hypothetical protein
MNIMLRIVGPKKIEDKANYAKVKEDSDAVDGTKHINHRK